MKRQKKNSSSGITLIALVISIIVMLILAGVSINALVGENGVLTQAQYATFFNEMAAVQEAVDMWKASNKIEDLHNENLPTKAVVKLSDLDSDKVGRLYGEIAYYRRWAENESKPTISVLSSTEDFNNEFVGDLFGSGSRIIDLYYLDTEAIGVSAKKEYIIDATTGLIYQYLGINIQNVNVHSLPMARSIQTGVDELPAFANNSEIQGPAGGQALANKYQPEYELNPDGTFKLDASGNKIPNANYNSDSFKFIASIYSNNIYKLYADGRLYGKGLKGVALQTSDAEMAKIDSTVFQELTIPSEIPSCKKLIPGSTDTMYVIDNNDNLWAWGNNNSNKLGLTQKQQNSYTGREAVQVNVAGTINDDTNVITGSKGVYNVFDIGSSLFVITTDNKLYACGYNGNTSQGGCLGLGHDNPVNSLTEVTGISDPKNIILITNGYISLDGVWVWYNNAPSDKVIFSAEWCAYNQFYISTKTFWCGYGGVKEKYIEENSCKFVRVFNGGDTGDDIDQDIVNSFSTSVGTLKLDGTYLQTNYLYGGLASGGAGGGSTSDQWVIRAEAVGKNFVKMWRNGSKTVLLDDNGELWGVGHNKHLLGYTEREWELNKIPNVPFNTNQIKEVMLTSGAAFYLLKDGTIWATGSYAEMGLGQDWSGDVIGFKNVTANFPEIESFYGGKFNGGNSELVKTQVADISGASNVLIGTDGKLYITASPTITFRNDIIEKNWVEVLPGKKVRDFDPTTIAYIDYDNNLYVAGSNSDYLGLNYATPTNVKIFTEVTDSKIKGKAVKCCSDAGKFGVLTSDNKLYMSGHGYYDNVFPGFNQTTNTKTFIEVASNVTNFEMKNGSTMFIDTDGKVSGWGHWRSWCNTGNTIVKSNTVNKNIKWMIPTDRASCVIDIDGKMWYSSENDWGNWWGATYNIGDYILWPGDGSSVAEEILTKEIKKIYRLGHIYMILTEDGYMYGWGPKAYLGINSTDSSESYVMYKLPIEDVEDLVAGSSWFVAVKRDGTVWGTGTNQYGVLGRWKGTDRKSTNSRYRTAFEWVQCPELEI